MKKLTTLTAVLCIMLFAAAATAAPKEFAIANDSTDDTITGLMTQKLKEVLEAKSKGAFKVATFP